jgi:diacylglycerol kinase family enzyme
VTNGPPIREVLIFTSPKAGSGGGQGLVAALARAISSQTLNVEVTASIADLKRRTATTAPAQDSGPDWPPRRCPDLVVAAGGDGTLSLVAHCTPPATLIAPMPIGTENLVAKHFGVTNDVGAMADTILRGRDLAIDAGVANGKLFLVMVTCGFDAEVVRAVHLTRRGHINRFSYFWPTIRAIRRYRFPELTVEFSPRSEPPDARSSIADGVQNIANPFADESLHCRWAMVFNLPRYAAGLGIEPEAIGDDGVLNLCAMKNGSVAAGFRYLAGVLCRRHIRWPDVNRRHIVGCRITAQSPVAFQIDGDYAGKLPLEIGILPGRVKLRLPRTESV